MAPCTPGECAISSSFQERACAHIEKIRTIATAPVRKREYEIRSTRAANAIKIKIPANAKNRSLYKLLEPNEIPIPSINGTNASTSVRYEPSRVSLFRQKPRSNQIKIVSTSGSTRTIAISPERSGKVLVGTNTLYSVSGTERIVRRGIQYASCTWERCIRNCGTHGAT